MRPLALLAAASGLFILIASTALDAQQAPQAYPVGNRLGLPIGPGSDGIFDPMSTNVKVFGSIYSAESCSDDAAAATPARTSWSSR
jgi:hypothetical protein